MPPRLRSFIPYAWAGGLVVLALAAGSFGAHAQNGLRTPGATPAAAVPAAPAPQACNKPAYPQQAIQARWTGISTFAFLIGENGTVKDARVLKSSGHGILDEAALAALRQCRFKPATTKKGRTVEAWQPVQYAWTLP